MTLIEIDALPLGSEREQQQPNNLWQEVTNMAIFNRSSVKSQLSKAMLS